MSFFDVVTTALGQIRSNKLRSFFTLLGIIVSVTFLVAVLAIIQGMNAYVKENIADAMIGANTFQVRRSPINVAQIPDDDLDRIKRRPLITHADADAVVEAFPDAEAVALTSGWPTPVADVTWRDRTVGDGLVFGVTSQYQLVQDYRTSEGRSLSDIDVAQRRSVVVLGADLAEKLFETVDPIGKEVRVRGELFTVVGVNEKKGSMLGQSFDGYLMIPLTRFEMMYGRRATTTVSIKMRTAEEVGEAMRRAQEVMRRSRHLRPAEDDDFSIETSEALVSFWKTLTSVLFLIVPAIVSIGIVVGGIVIMNIMLMSVTERTHEIGIRKALGATARDIERQFLAEAIALSVLGGLLGVSVGWLMATTVAAVSPLPTRVAPWSVALALGLGAGVGVLFGVYPARRAARLDPISAMRAE